MADFVCYNFNLMRRFCLFFGFIAVFLCLFLTRISYAEVSLEIVNFYPEEDIRQNVPFEIVFRISNTGEEAINPFAEVTLSGEVYTDDGESVLRLVDKKYRVYNLWPGETSGKLWFYVGALERKGIYKLKLRVNAYNLIKNKNLSNKKLEIPIYVK